MNQVVKDRIEKIEQGVVPEGYKKTKVGIIPKDWEVKKLEKVVKLTNEKYNPKHSKKIYKCIELEHIEQDAGIINGYIYSSKIKSSKNYFKPGDVLYGKLRPYLKKFFKPDFEGVCSTEIWVLQNRSDVLTSDYLYYMIQTQKFDYVANISTGSSMPRADWEYVGASAFSLPTLEEQKSIVDILSTWDKMLERIENLIKEKEIQKKGLMQQLLTGENRLTGFKQEWKDVKLREIADRITEKNNLKSKNVLTISAIDGLVNQEKYFSKQIASRNLDNYTYLEKGDFAYNKSYSKGFPLGTIKMLEMYEAGVVSSLYICFRANESVHKSYLKQYFDANMFNHEIYKVAQEGARNHGLLNIGLKDFFDIKLNIPPLKEQKAIADILSTADKEIELLRELLVNKKEEKKGLMQLLLTGIIRV